MSTLLAGTPDWYANTSGAAPFNAPVTRAGGEGLLAFVFYEYDFGAPSAISSVTWDPTGDNQPMVLLGTKQHGNSANRWVSAWYLPNPTSAKTGNVVAAFAGATLSRVDILTRHVTGGSTTANWTVAMFNGVFGNVSGAATQTVSDSIASAAGYLCVDCFSWRNTSSTLFANSGQGDVVKYEPVSGSRAFASSSLAGAATTTLGWNTIDGAYDYAHILVSIPASAGGSTNGTATGAALTGTASIAAGSASGGAAGSTNGTANGAALTGTATISAGTASGTSGASGASFACDTMINNTGTVLANQAVVWSWHQSGRIGQASPSVTYGTGTINGSGALILTGLPAGAGFALVAVRGADATTDAVYYDAGTAA